MHLGILITVDPEFMTQAEAGFPPYIMYCKRDGAAEETAYRLALDIMWTNPAIQAWADNRDNLRDLVTFTRVTTLDRPDDAVVLREDGEMPWPPQTDIEPWHLSPASRAACVHDMMTNITNRGNALLDDKAYRNQGDVHCDLYHKLAEEFQLYDAGDHAPVWLSRVVAGVINDWYADRDPG